MSQTIRMLSNEGLFDIFFIFLGVRGQKVFYFYLTNQTVPLGGRSMGLLRLPPLR